MSRAGKLALCAALAALASAVIAQPTAIHPTPNVPKGIPRLAASPQPASADRESSLTIQQIVARQEDHFATIKNAQGTAVHADVRFDAQARPTQKSAQYIFFAYEGDRSVTLAMPEAAAQFYKSNQGQVPWPQITSAFHIAGDAVYVIRKGDSSTTTPDVMAMPYNPAVHENNPLVAFHIRQISDEQIPLRDLARAVPNMPQRPKVYDIIRDGKLLLRIQFSNPNTPGELLDYLIDPSRGYLPVEIVRSSNGKAISVSRITIGHTPDGTWVPAKRERLTYAGGKVVGKQNWHFDYLAINKKLAPKTLSLMYFNLPLTTPVQVVSGGAAVTSGTRQQTVQGRTGPASVQGTVQRQTPVLPAPTPSPTPMPRRAAPTPSRVVLP